MSNQIRFDSYLLSEESLIEESVLKWIPLGADGLFRHQYQLQVGSSNLQDLIIDLDDLTEYIDDFFSIQKLDLLPKTKDPNVLLDVLF